MTQVEANLKLFKQITPGEPPTYILESKADFMTENLVESGHGPLPTTQNADGDIEIDLFVADNPNIVDNSEPYVVKHTVVLGTLNYASAPYRVLATIKKGGVKKGKGHVKSESVVIITR